MSTEIKKKGGWLFPATIACGMRQKEGKHRSMEYNWLFGLIISRLMKWYI